jgi:DUF971 family protein
MLEPIPIEVKRISTKSQDKGSIGTGIEINWSNGANNIFSSRTLRVYCPCAECREKRGDINHSKPISNKSSPLTILSATEDEETNLVSIWAIGNYALGILWGDNHDSGIFSYEYLRHLRALQIQDEKEN